MKILTTLLITTTAALAMEGNDVINNDLSHPQIHIVINNNNNIDSIPTAPVINITNTPRPTWWTDLEEETQELIDGLSDEKSYANIGFDGADCLQDEVNSNTYLITYFQDQYRSAKDVYYKIMRAQPGWTLNQKRVKLYNCGKALRHIAKLDMAKSVWEDTTTAATLVCGNTTIYNLDMLKVSEAVFMSGRDFGWSNLNYNFVNQLEQTRKHYNDAKIEIQERNQQNINIINQELDRHTQNAILEVTATQREQLAKEEQKKKKELQNKSVQKKKLVQQTGSNKKARNVLDKEITNNNRKLDKFNGKLSNSQRKQQKKQNNN